MPYTWKHLINVYCNYIYINYMYKRYLRENLEVIWLVLSLCTVCVRLSLFYHRERK